MGTQHRTSIVSPTPPEQAGVLLSHVAGYIGHRMSLWCRSALAAGVLQRADIGYERAPHMATLPLDAGAPGFVGALFPLVQQPEMFQHFEQRLSSGERTWWDRTSPDWITGVAATGRPFYSGWCPAGSHRSPGWANGCETGAGWSIPRPLGRVGKGEGRAGRSRGPGLGGV